MVLFLFLRSYKQVKRQEERDQKKKKKGKENWEMRGKKTKILQKLNNQLDKGLNNPKFTVKEKYVDGSAVYCKIVLRTVMIVKRSFSKPNVKNSSRKSK